MQSKTPTLHRRPGSRSGLEATLCGGLLVVGLFTFQASPMAGQEGSQGVERDPPCAALEGLDAALERSSLLIFGEIHGTVQSPALIEDVVCNIAAGGRPVTLALELPRDEQALLDAVLASDSADSLAVARNALLGSPFWSHGQPDGRSSQAMWQLLEGLHQLRRQGHDLEVVAFDIPLDAPRQQREEKMSTFLADAIAASPDDIHIVLTGNLHSRVHRGTYLPLAGHLKQTYPKLLSFDVAHDGGTAWVCLRGPQGCQIQKVGPRQPRPKRGIYLLEEADRFGHLGVYQVGPLTASEPAADR